MHQPLASVPLVSIFGNLTVFSQELRSVLAPPLPGAPPPRAPRWVLRLLLSGGRISESKPHSSGGPAPRVAHSPAGSAAARRGCCCPHPSRSSCGTRPSPARTVPRRSPPPDRPPTWGRAGSESAGRSPHLCWSRPRPPAPEVTHTPLSTWIACVWGPCRASSTSGNASLTSTRCPSKSMASNSITAGSPKSVRMTLREVSASS